MAKEEPKAELAKTEITSNINMNLNQNDVIEVAIQEYLSVLEPKLIAADEAYKAALDTWQEKNSEFTQEICKGVGGGKVVTDFLELCKRYKMEANFGVQANKSAKRSPIVTYPKGDMGYAESYKEPLSQFRRNTRNQDMWLNSPDTIVSLTGNSANDADGPELRFQLSNLSLKISKTKAENFIQKITPFYKAIGEAGKALYDLQVEYLEYKHNDKKIKAKVVKESLSRSKEGRAILGLLQDATKVKLLS